MSREFDTDAVHGGSARIDLTNAPVFDDADHARREFADPRTGNVYGRWNNATVRAFETHIARLEGGEDAVATASGMAAISGVLGAFLDQGDHVIAPLGVYAETAKLLRERFARFGIETSFVDMCDLDAVDAARRERTRVIWCETPANPRLAIYDIAALAERSGDALLVVDATFATPYHQRALELGADVVVHSATKSLGGHGDAIGGVVVSSRSVCVRVHDDAVRAGGAVMSPWVAFLLSRGLQTLALRMQRASHNALQLALRLEADTRVQSVSYPGLPSHRQHALAATQMQRGFGAMLAFELVGGLDRGREAHDRLRLITRSVSLGDTRTLVTHPASTTHASMPPEQRVAAGIGDGLFRLSVGIEDVEDLWRDLDRALGPT